MNRSRSVGIAAGALAFGLLASACGADSSAGQSERARWESFGGIGEVEFGRVPDEAKRPDGSTNYDALPDYIETLGRDGKPVGYVPREYLFSSDGDSNELEATEIPVFDRELDLVGFMTDVEGFVAVGDGNG